MFEHLFATQAASPNAGFVIVEAWAMDCPNHGHSAALNDSKAHLFKDGIGEHPARLHILQS